MDSLLIQIRSQVTPYWYQFGIAVGIDKEVLEKYSRYPSEECIVEVLDYWLKNHHSKPTWKNVAEALKDIGLHRYAEKILKVYETGEK